MIVVTFDDLDEDQGSYFSSCARELESYLPLYFSDKKELLFGSNLHSISVEICLNQINHSPYIFSAFCHGTDLSLNAKRLPFLKSRENTHLLRNSIIYTNACSAGKDFGIDVIEKGAIAFVGYNEEVDSLIAEDLLSTSVRCDNYALHLFLHNNQTLRESVESAKRWFTEESRRIIKLQNPFVAALLVANRDALVIHGNENITCEDFFSTDS